MSTLPPLPPTMCLRRAAKQMQVGDLCVGALIKKADGPTTRGLFWLDRITEIGKRPDGLGGRFILAVESGAPILPLVDYELTGLVPRHVAFLINANPFRHAIRAADAWAAWIAKPTPKRTAKAMTAWLEPYLIADAANP